MATFTKVYCALAIALVDMTIAAVAMTDRAMRIEAFIICDPFFCLAGWAATAVLSSRAQAMPGYPLMRKTKPGKHALAYFFSDQPVWIT
jgi:hypothetical protein